MPKSTYIRPRHFVDGGSKKFSMLPQLPSSSVSGHSIDSNLKVPSAVIGQARTQFSKSASRVSCRDWLHCARVQAARVLKSLLWCALASCWLTERSHPTVRISD